MYTQFQNQHCPACAKVVVCVYFNLKIFIAQDEIEGTHDHCKCLKVGECPMEKIGKSNFQFKIQQLDAIT